MTFSAVATTGKIADRISSSRSGCMMHGPTFMANPLACAVALASTRLLLDSPWQKRIKQIGVIMRHRLETAKKWECVADVRVLGGIGVIELKKEINLGEFQKHCVEEGVWIRPFGRNAYIMPPYLAVSDVQVEKLCDALLRIIRLMYVDSNQPGS